MMHTSIAAEARQLAAELTLFPAPSETPDGEATGPTMIPKEEEEDPEGGR